MNKFTFVLLVVVYFLSLIYQSFGHLTVDNQLVFCIALVSLFGIPHGSIDHVLYVSKMKSSKLFFYSFYFGLIFLYVLLWLYFPVISFIFFLLLSAYHFGESQFHFVSFDISFLKNIFYFVYGIFVISTLIYFNIPELKSLSQFNQDTIILDKIFDQNIISYAYYVSLFVIIIFKLSLLYLKKFSISGLFNEIFTLFLINIISFIFPFVISFTLYFVLLHSIPVMFQEFKFLKEDNSNFNYRNFILLLLQYTLVSLFFTFIIFYCSYIQLIDISIPYLSMIIISVITLPHAVVMNLFYNK